MVNETLSFSEAKYGFSEQGQKSRMLTKQKKNNLTCS